MTHSVVSPSQLSQLNWVRSQFPALLQTVNDQPVVFFDAPGGTQVPQCVIDAMTHCLTHANANLHGAFVNSQRADVIVAEAHSAMADLLGCDAGEIVFGPNMTSLTFALSRALGRELLPGNEILTTLLDHDANVAPWRALEDRGVRVYAINIRSRDCTLDLEDFHKKLFHRTKIVAVGYASNAVGTINLVEEIIASAHAHGALVFVDAVHYAPHRAIDVKKLNCDFLACSPYKFFGPHAGVLYGKREHLERLVPYKVRPASDQLPGRWETGTQSHEAMAGVTACVDYLATLGRLSTEQPSRRDAILAAYDWIDKHESAIGARLIDGLLTIPGLSFYGPKVAPGSERTPTVCIRLANYSPAEVAQSLGEAGIFTWHGNFYALNLSEQLGVEPHGGFLRIGLAHYNTANEVDRLLHHLQSLARRR